MIQKAKYALAFVLGNLYIGSWWLELTTKHLNGTDTRGIYALGVWGVIVGTILIILFTIIAYIDHWDD